MIIIVLCSFFFGGRPIVDFGKALFNSRKADEGNASAGSSSVTDTAEKVKSLEVSVVAVKPPPTDIVKAKEKKQEERCKIKGVICLNKLNKVEQNLKTSHAEEDINWAITVCNQVDTSRLATSEEKEKASTLRKKVEKLKNSKTTVWDRNLSISDGEQQVLNKKRESEEKNN